MKNRIQFIWERIRNDVTSYRDVIAALLLYYAAARIIFHAFCPMVIATGLPCPGCGLSRAAWFLLIGQFARAFSMHPMAVWWLLLTVYFGVNRYVTGRGVTKLFLAALTVVCIATIVVYAYRMLTLFPDRPPMSYTGRNLLERWIPGYRRTVVTFFRLCR
ncbi:MAG: DUF2752 domain-containing protein [Lachnospiraceae bacterium]|nr:DUF2752 domain-containing protein [Lachnospiraceae bacterium]